MHRSMCLTSRVQKLFGRDGTTPRRRSNPPGNSQANNTAQLDNLERGTEVSTEGDPNWGKLSGKKTDWGL